MLTSHHGSHAGLFTHVDAAGVRPGQLDAIIVPTVRPGWQLSSAMQVAAKLNCPLLCLSSRESVPADVLETAMAANAEAVVVDTTDALPRLLPDLATTRLVTERGFGRGTDLSGKRNLGLLIGRAMGWRKILFLDDDILKLDIGDLRALAGLLDRHDAVGLGNTGYPDNSVVCHAYREVGGRQESFVSGGLLSISVDRLDGFFPDIYNEDWFFLHSAARIARTGAAYQDEYDPFASVQRARDEELGDCLAEGLYWLRDERRSPDTALREHFWETFLAGRRDFIDEITRRLHTTWRGDRESRAQRLASLAAARELHTRDDDRRITPGLCVDFIRAWRDDLAAWRKHRTDVAAPASIEECLRRLEECHSPTTRTDWNAKVHRSGLGPRTGTPARRGG